MVSLSFAGKYSDLKKICKVNAILKYVQNDSYQITNSPYTINLLANYRFDIVLSSDGMVWYAD